MLYLLLAIASSTSIIVLFKIFSRLKINTFYVIMVNYVVAAGFGFLTADGAFSFAEIPSKPWFLVAVVSGLLFIVGFNLFALSAHHAGVALTGMASRMSLIVSVTAGFLVFGDQPGIWRITGIILGVAAFYLTFRFEQAETIHRRFIFLPVALLLVHGSSDLMMKIAQQYYIRDDFSLFLATVFLIALVLGIVYLLFSQTIKEKFTWKELVAGISIGLVNWYSGYFLLLGLTIFDVSFVIPIINISIVTASTLIGFFVFKEPLKLINWVGVGLALASILMMLG